MNNACDRSTDAISETNECTCKPELHKSLRKVIEAENTCPVHSETNVDLPRCERCGATLLLFDKHKCGELEYPAYRLRDVTKKVEESKLNTLSSGFGHKDNYTPDLKEFDDKFSHRDIECIHDLRLFFISSIERARREGRKEMMGDILKACADGKAKLTLDIKKMFPEEVK